MRLAKPPSLHLKLAANHLVDNLIKVWPGFTSFLEEMGIKTSDYFGGNLLEGNDVNKLFRRLDQLEERIPEEHKLFHQCFVEMKSVVEGCLQFSLNPEYPTIIQRFSEAFKELRNCYQMTETVKFHIITTHLRSVLDHCGTGLGQFGEQEVEASHSVFHRMWTNRFYVKYVECMCILTFNTQNLG